MKNLIRKSNCLTLALAFCLFSVIPINIANAGLDPYAADFRLDTQPGIAFDEVQPESEKEGTTVKGDPLIASPLSEPSRDKSGENLGDKTRKYIKDTVQLNPHQLGQSELTVLIPGSDQRYAKVIFSVDGEVQNSYKLKYDARTGKVSGQISPEEKITIQFDKLGQITSYLDEAKSANGTVRAITYTFDPPGRVTQIHDESSRPDGFRAQSDADYEYDESGLSRYGRNRIIVYGDGSSRRIEEEWWNTGRRDSRIYKYNSDALLIEAITNEQRGSARVREIKTYEYEMAYFVQSGEWGARTATEISETWTTNYGQITHHRGVRVNGDPGVYVSDLRKETLERVDILQVRVNRVEGDFGVYYVAEVEIGPNGELRTGTVVVDRGGVSTEYRIRHNPGYGVYDVEFRDGNGWRTFCTESSGSGGCLAGPIELFDLRHVVAAIMKVTEEWFDRYRSGPVVVPTESVTHLRDQFNHQVEPNAEVIFRTQGRRAEVRYNGNYYYGTYDPDEEIIRVRMMSASGTLQIMAVQIDALGGYSRFIDYTIEGVEPV